MYMCSTVAYVNPSSYFWLLTFVPEMPVYEIPFRFSVHILVVENTNLCNFCGPKTKGFPCQQLQFVWISENSI